MRVLGASLIGVLVLVVAGAAAAPEAGALDGRWKFNGAGECYFDETDSGPNQCFPQTGRWKVASDGSCYFDQTDGGPDQCSPVGAATDLEADDVAVLPESHEVVVHAVGPGAPETGTGQRPAPALAR